MELALILPVFLLLFASALDLGRLFYAQITITDAAREGALEAARNPGSFQANQPCDTTTNRVMCRTVNEARGGFIAVSTSDVSLTCSTSPCPPTTAALGNTVTVRVRGTFTLLTPLLSTFFGGQAISLSSTATSQLVVAPVFAASPTPTPTPTPTETATPTPTPTPTATPTPPPCPAPVASFTVSPTSGSAANNGGQNGTLFTFDSSATTNMGDPACSPIWSWSFGDGAGTSSNASPTYTYTKASKGTTRVVTLVASNSGGNSTYSVSIPVY